MSTRSTIAIEFADGTVHQVYCHFDGYLSGIGRQLQEEFLDPWAAASLIAQGDMSFIGAPYTQRGDHLHIGRYRDFNDYASNGQDEEYDYILRQVDGAPVWFVRCYDTQGRFVQLTSVMETA